MKLIHQRFEKNILHCLKNPRLYGKVLQNRKFYEADGI